MTLKFTLDGDTGVITTYQELDRETVPEYLLCIEASRPRVTGKKRREVGYRGRRATMEEDLKNRTNHDIVLYVKVIVEDINDLPPVFREPLVKTGKSSKLPESP